MLLTNPPSWRDFNSIWEGKWLIVSGSLLSCSGGHGSNEPHMLRHFASEELNPKQPNSLKLSLREANIQCWCYSSKMWDATWQWPVTSAVLTWLNKETTTNQCCKTVKHRCLMCAYSSCSHSITTTLAPKQRPSPHMLRRCSAYCRMVKFSSMLFLWLLCKFIRCFPSSHGPRPKQEWEPSVLYWDRVRTVT